MKYEPNPNRFVREGFDQDNFFLYPSLFISNSQNMPNTRINSRSFDDLNDHERLQDRCISIDCSCMFSFWEGYSEIKIKSDGNCQFRALADQLYKTSDCHKRVRQEIIQQLKSHPKLYKGFVDKMEFSEYVKNMSNNKVWGDEVTLKAAADVYGVKIVLITSFKDITSTEILPKSRKQPDRVIYLSYLAGIHYNSIHKNEGLYTKEETEKENGNEKKKKKKNDLFS
ncbi:unnamed protein product [Arabidopsis halleri]